jgi:phosphoribosyl 1,2-cyclic phosphate phosphodiesterase
VPVIGCTCAVCASTDPRNHRFRSAALVRTGAHTVLVDSGPDLRAQALREGLREIDAVIYTHSHLDHVAGFDELRAFCWRRDSPLPMHATQECMNTLKRMYGWAFSEENVYQGYVKPDARSIAYLPDVKRIPNDTLWHIRGVDVLVVDALRPQPHPTHCSIGEALEIIRETAPGEAWLTHLGHENDHERLGLELPAGVKVAWDGLKIPL